ncbi:MAG: AAA family ATPase [Roseovarius sp.]|nr:AAA family ATPase [Roseovarius sp.]
MRLRRLCLDRFGHFTGRDFDFGTAGDGADFHIIHGPNEAGKTTAMEGALRLFYGFPHRESYDFKHQRKNLRVSAVVEIEGAPRHFTRLPLRSGALVDETGTALPEAALAAHLGGLGEEDYRNLLCLDDDTIERGGEEIAQARGDIGRLLFSAAAGVADLSTALDAVRDEATAIWRKSASKTRVAGLKRALTDVEKAIREGDVSASAWRKLKKALAAARDAEAGARAARDRLQARAATLDAERRALPQIAEIDALAARIAPLDGLSRPARFRSREPCCPCRRGKPRAQRYRATDRRDRYADRRARRARPRAGPARAGREARCAGRPAQPRRDRRSRPCTAARSGGRGRRGDGARSARSGGGRGH